MSQHLNANGTARSAYDTGPSMMELEREAESSGRSKEEILAEWYGATPEPKAAPKRAAKPARK